MSRQEDIQLRHGTAAAWTAANPVLDVGEAGVETDTGKLKVGNGVTAWTSLPYAGGGGSTTPTASTVAEWDANVNLSANAFFPGFTTTATAGGTTTLSITSTETQVFTGSSTQTVKLPTTSTPAGAQYTILNNSTGTITVQSSAGNTIDTVTTGVSKVFTALQATPTAATHWFG